jgi:plastocyanin
MRRLWALGVVLAACMVSRVPRAESRELRTISIAGFRFLPAEMTASAGDTVTWTNDDTFRHSTTADSGAWASPELGHGQRFVFVPKHPGRYLYHCAAHPVMRAVVVVRE